ncbi:MAG: hypothetical protein QHJ73_15490, partial [Armatimonadota bacterium]|nr:hypothetical protein [Armatimonadota bacterium]
MRCLWPLMTSLLALLLAVVAAAGSASAAPNVRASLVDAQGSSVTFAGHLLLRLRTPLGENSPPQRAQIVADRLRAALTEGADPEGISVRRGGKTASIYWGSAALLTVTVAEGRAQRSEPD